MLLQDANHSPLKSAERLFHCISWEVRLANYFKNHAETARLKKVQNKPTQYNHKKYVGVQCGRTIYPTQVNLTLITTKLLLKRKVVQEQEQN